MTSSSAASSTTVTTSGGSPGPKIARGYTLGLGTVMFGVYLSLLTPVLVSMAFKIQHITPDDATKQSALGLVLGVGALFALVANPLVGRLSDRTTSRFGMRRPWILGGAIAGVLGFTIIGMATQVWMVLIGWCIAQTALNATLSAAQATLPDQVPEAKRGGVSGIMGLTTPIGILVGTGLVSRIPGDLGRFLVPALIALVVSIFFVIVLKDRVLTEKPAEKFSFKVFLGSFVFNPRKHPDFGWAWLTKFFFMFGYAGIATFVPFYLTDKFGLGEQEVLTVIFLSNLAANICMVVSSPLGGFLSDKFGKRRPFVLVAGLVMVVGLVLLAFAPSVAMVIVAQAVVGLGAGSFMSVDLALATQVLPDPEDTAKDLGVLNMANALPQSIAPAVAPTIIAIGAGTAIGGYACWFLFGAFVSFLGAVLVYRIKGVK